MVQRVVSRWSAGEQAPGGSVITLGPVAVNRRRNPPPLGELPTKTFSLNSSFDTLDCYVQTLVLRGMKNTGKMERYISKRCFQRHFSVFFFKRLFSVPGMPAQGNKLQSSCNFRTAQTVLNRDFTVSLRGLKPNERYLTIRKKALVVMNLLTMLTT